MSAARRFLIDTDTASDDAVALLMALRRPDVEVVAITTVFGNVPVERGTRNALYAAELAGVDVPVHAGAHRPLVVEPVTAQFFHGQDGLGDQGYPPPERQAAPGHGVGALIECVRAEPELTLVTLGPLTNLALAIRLAPDLVQRVGRCVVMGGAACTVGNVTPAAEYNLWVDPHAAHAVFASGLPIEMVGWELCRGEANLDEAEMAELRAHDTPFARFVVDCNTTAIRVNREWLGEPGLALPDPVAMAVALEPERVVRRSGRHHVAIEHASELTRGASVVDRLGVRERETNATVVWEIDVDRFKAMLREAVR